MRRNGHLEFTLKEIIVDIKRTPFAIKVVLLDE
jgi:hypothetical protein